MTKRELSRVYYNITPILSCYYITSKIEKASDLNIS